MSVQAPQKEVKVWDIFIRLFHWTLVVSFIVAYFTGDEDNLWHIYSGYYIAFLIVFRVIWGFIGTRYARFTSFVYSPGAVIAYIKRMMAKNPKHYLGHNPAGGYMVIALLFMLTVTTITGLKVYGVEGYGPLANNSRNNNPAISLISVAMADDDDFEKADHNKLTQREDEGKEDQEDKEGEDEYKNGKQEENPAEEFWEEAHELAANLTVFLILLHILGVIVSSKLDKENLVRAMITGNKTVK